MKRFAIISFIFVIIICGISYMYLNYKNMYKKDNNEKNEVSKNKKGIYIENDTNSIKIEIKITDNDNIYNMETIYNNGTQNFLQYYGEIKFKCVDIKYHTETNKVKYMLFEQE